MRAVLWIDPARVPAWVGRLREAAGDQVTGWVRAPADPPDAPARRAWLAMERRVIGPGWGVAEFGGVDDLLPDLRERTDLDGVDCVVVATVARPPAFDVPTWALGDGHRPFPASPGTAEVAGGALHLHSRLWQLSPSGDRALESLRTRVHARSLRRTLHFAAVRAADVIARRLRLGEHDPRWLAFEPGPVPADIGRLAAAVAFRVVRERHAPIPRWHLAYGHGDRFDRHALHTVVPAPGQFQADPFCVEREGRRVVFFEELDYDHPVGRICAAEVRGDGSWHALGPVLSEGFHLSYPQVVEDDGELWMIPESGARGMVQAWHCVDFPTRWAPGPVLISGVGLADPTLVRHEGRWWMFATAHDDGDRSDALLLFSAPALPGPWTPHRRNPLRVDVRSARCGGALEVHPGLQRVAQDCGGRYGRALVRLAVVRLDDDDLEERTLQTIEPWDRQQVGVHTLNRQGDLWVVDRRMAPPPAGLRARLGR